MQCAQFSFRLAIASLMLGYNKLSIIRSVPIQHYMNTNRETIRRPSHSHFPIDIPFALSAPTFNNKTIQNCKRHLGAENSKISRILISDCFQI